MTREMSEVAGVLPRKLVISPKRQHEIRAGGLLFTPQSPPTAQPSEQRRGQEKIKKVVNLGRFNSWKRGKKKHCLSLKGLRRAGLTASCGAALLGRHKEHSEQELILQTRGFALKSVFLSPLRRQKSGSRRKRRD